MTFMFTVSPDFSPDYLPGWYIFNTWLQKRTGLSIHLETYGDFQSQHEAVRQGGIDLIYANSYDAAMLVREKGFLPLVRPQGIADETVIAVGAESGAQDVADLQPGIRLAFTDHPDVRLMGMIMLEAGDLHAGNVVPVLSNNYVLVAKHLLKGEADAGIFLAKSFDDLSSVIKKQLRVLVRSQIGVIRHALLAGPRLYAERQRLCGLLPAMSQDEKGRAVLQSLGMAGWEAVEDEDVEFMIDLMDALAF